LKLQNSAIDQALVILQNEPKWHNLAAVIYQNICNIVEAIHHFDEAIRLEPHNLENHLGLGKTLIEMLS
jgi:tetratricopeptide (TPR) repeat protein